jgi:hypothetical protein
MFVFEGEQFFVYHGLVEGHGGGKRKSSAPFYQRRPGTASPIRSIERAQPSGTKFGLPASRGSGHDRRTP